MPMRAVPGSAAPKPEGAGKRAAGSPLPGRRHMFGQFELAPEPLGVDGVVVDGVVAAAGVPEDELPPDDEPVAAFAIATTPPAIAPVASRLASIVRNLIASLLSSVLLCWSIPLDACGL